MTAERRETEPEEVALDKPEPMLSERDILQLIPIGRATLYRMMREGTFPRGTFVSPNRRLGSRARLPAGSKRLTHTVRTVAGAKGAAALVRPRGVYSTPTHRGLRPYANVMPKAAGSGFSPFRGTNRRSSPPGT